MQEAINWIVAHSADLITIVLGSLGVFSVVAKLTPWEGDNKAVDALYKVVHFLGLSKKA